MEKTKQTVYKSAENYIIDLIKTRRLAVNDRIPSQREIGSSLDASQFSVRMAMDNLAARGILRKAGSKKIVVNKEMWDKEKTNTIGILYWMNDEDFYTNPFYAGVLSGVKLNAEREEKFLTYRSLAKPFGQGIIKKVIKEISSKVDGLLIIELLPKMIDDITSVLREIRVPSAIMLTEGVPGDMDTVVFDHAQNVRDVVALLYDLGHRRIAYVIQGSRFADPAIFGRTKIRAFQNEMEDRCIPPEDMPVVFLDRNDPGQPRPAFHNLLNSKRRPTAVIGHTDQDALLTYGIARELGLTIPDDLTIIGYDDSVQAGLMRPGLTTVRLPMLEIGTQAFELLLKKTESCGVPGQHPVKISLRGTIIQRESHTKV